MLKIADVETGPVVAVSAHLSATAALRILALAPRSALIVTEEHEQPIGLLSAAQILRFVGAEHIPSLHPTVLAAFEACADGVEVADVMAPTPVVGENDPRVQVIGAFLRSGLSHLPVVDDLGRAVGAVSREEVRAASARARSEHPEFPDREVGITPQTRYGPRHQ